MSAEIINLGDHRPLLRDGLAQDMMPIDLQTAVDAALRDLREIRLDWGSVAARERLIECEQMLSQAFAAS